MIHEQLMKQLVDLNVLILVLPNGLEVPYQENLFGAILGEDFESRGPLYQETVFFDALDDVFALDVEGAGDVVNQHH